MKEPLLDSDSSEYGRQETGEWEHRFDLDTDSCSCGGQVVYFEDGDRSGRYGEGCEVADQVFKKTFRFVIMTPGGWRGPEFTGRGHDWIDASEEAEKKATEAGFDVVDAMDLGPNEFVLVIEE